MLKLSVRRSSWFTVDQDASGDTKLKINHLMPGEVADIEAKASRIIGKQVGETFHTEVDFALREKTKKFVLESVVDWEGFEDTEGKKLACNNANKSEVIKQFDWFCDFVEKCRGDLAKEALEATEGAGKN